MTSHARSQRVAVIGGGIGGLTAAYDLAQAGHRVTLFEQQAAPGGKIHQEQVLGQSIDSGPTVMTMRWVFDDLLAPSGRQLEDLVDLQPLDVLARHHWPDGSRLDLYTDLEKSRQAILAFAGQSEAAAFGHFMQQAQAVYHRLEPIYMRGERPSFLGLTRSLGPTGLAMLTRLGPLQSLAQHLERRFRDPRLQQLFARYATYCGGSPWQAPATLLLIAYVELRGVWAMSGGMQALAQAMAKAVEELGGKIQYRMQVQQILEHNQRACGLLVGPPGETAERYDFDAVVFNGDIGLLKTSSLLPPDRRQIPSRQCTPSSLSAMTWSGVVRAEGFGLQYHNVFFQDHYMDEFTAIFRHRRMPERPTVYVCAQDRLAGRAGQSTDDQMQEKIFMLINAPAYEASRSAFPPEEIEQCQERVLSRLAQSGLKLSMQAPMTIKTPSDFGQRFPGSKGALYGRAPHGWLSVFHRASSRGPMPGLYLAGGTVHPGAGVPMAALSGRLAAACLMEDLASTRSSRRVVISGGMSMA
ncbi:MAG: 1-hydroxycarotenoid 3,4-desaturase CrtD [Burkholderiaceae bacterium]